MFEIRHCERPVIKKRRLFGNEMSVIAKERTLRLRQSLEIALVEVAAPQKNEARNDVGSQ